MAIPTRGAEGPQPSIILTCGCTRPYTLEDWLRLPLRAARLADGAGGWLELRNCPCGSTRARQLPREPRLAKTRPARRPEAA